MKTSEYKFVPVTLEGVNPQFDKGSLLINRRVQERPSVIELNNTKPYELACVLAEGMWQAFFWYPHGEKDDKKSFFRFRVYVREDMVDDVLACAKPRITYEEGADFEKLTPEVQEMITQSGIVLAKDLKGI